MQFSLRDGLDCLFIILLYWAFPFFILSSFYLTLCMNHLLNLSFSLHGADPSLCLVWIFVGLDFCPFHVEYSPSPFGKSSWSYLSYLLFLLFSCTLLLGFYGNVCFTFRSPTMRTAPESKRYTSCRPYSLHYLAYWEWCSNAALG